MDNDQYCGATKAAEVCQIMPKHAVAQMEKLIDQCRLTDHILSTDGRIAGNAPLATRAGFVAEEYHAETFNLDAILKDENVRAFTDRYPNTPLSGNNPTNDILIARNGKIEQGIQLKYYKDGKTTANAFRTSKDGVAHYRDTDTMLGPADQLNDIKIAAKRTELKNQSTRPQVAAAARDVQKKVTDHIEQDGVRSGTLTKKGAEQFAKRTPEAKKAHQQVQNQYKNASTIQQSLKAAGSAAVISSAIAGTINTFHYLDLVQKGEMSLKEAVGKILLNTTVAAGDSALKAGGATMAASMTARAFPDFFRGSVLQSSLKTGIVAGTAVCAIDLVECLVLFAAGKISEEELKTRTGMNVIQTATGSAGAAVGAAVGAVAGPVGTVIGGIVGGLITSVATTMCIENHVEKTFFENMENTQSLIQTEIQLNQMIQFSLFADAYFSDFYKKMVMDFVQARQELDQIHKNGLRIDQNIERRAKQARQEQNALDQKIVNLLNRSRKH